MNYEYCKSYSYDYKTCFNITYTNICGLIIFMFQFNFITAIYFYFIKICFDEIKLNIV